MAHTIPNPRPRAELVSEIHDELYEAVYAGDLDTAKLDELAMTGTESFRGRVYAAKRRAGVLS